MAERAEESNCAGMRMTTINAHGVRDIKILSVTDGGYTATCRRWRWYDTAWDWIVGKWRSLWKR